MKRTRYIVHLPGDEIARFSNVHDALAYGRMISREQGAMIEVGAPDGLIGQFNDGDATPEFAHLDRR
jgi:hypothetical protein